MPDFIGDDFDKAPVTVPPKDDKRGRPKKEVRDSILLRMIRPKLTEHELSEILELAKEHGSLVDLVALALKKMVNPELLTMSDLKMCLDRASQINMYFQSVATQGTTPYAQIDKIVNDVANQVESQGAGNPNNPLTAMMKPLLEELQKQMALSIQEGLKSQVKNMIPGLLPANKPNEAKPPVNNNNNNDEDFVGDQ